MADWNPVDPVPDVPGWYQVRRIDDDDGKFGVRMRAFGRDLQWWTPLPDGWLSSRDGIYEWRGPPIPLEPHGSTMPPTEEERRASEQYSQDSTTEKR